MTGKHEEYFMREGGDSHALDHLGEVLVNRR